jgi:pilus assembly protein CpaB
MSRSRFLILAVIALTLSVAVTYVTYGLLTDGANAPDQFVNVMVAARDLPLGTRLEPEDVRLSPWPDTLLLEGRLEEADMTRMMGRGTLYPIAASEPILESKLAPEGSGAGLAPTIPEGMRAMSVRVNEVIGVAGFILPGTRVDVILSGSPNGSDLERSKAFLENVTVLSAGQNLERSANGEPQNVQVVTLLVSPEDAQALALAQGNGNIQLALRNPLDLDVPDPQATLRANLFEQRNGVSTTARPPTPRSAAPVALPAPPPPPAPVLPPPPPRPVSLDVELIQGASSETVTFEVEQD